MIIIGKKTYLSKQVRLIEISTFDLLTQKETEMFRAIENVCNQIDESKGEKKKELIELRRNLYKEFDAEIINHNGTPRCVNLNSVMKTNADSSTAATWRRLKPTRQIAEFLSEQTRSMRLSHLDITYDKIIVKWKNLEILKQIILDGFTMDILLRDGTITTKRYRFYTSSAGQLRRDKVQFISEEMYDKIHDRMYCGLSWEKINEHGGINISKLMAYLALPSSATDEWNFPIEKCIVVKDFEAPVTDMMDYISPDYHITRGIREVTINHCDGAGMALPGVLPAANTQVRGPWIKGLLSTFDFLRFCDEHKIRPVVTDVWGQEHDLITEDIQVIFTESQHKLWKYYDSWKQYCDYFNKYGCHLCITNPEEDFIKDTEVNYQFLQSIDMTDDEIDAFTRKTHQRIENMACNKDAMLQTLRANEDSYDYYNQAIYLYNELLNDAQAKETLKAIKKRMTLDAKSGSIRCKNKRLFALPDMYAFCERLFLNVEKPEGLLKNGEVFSRLHLQYDEGDILRSPHLYRDHALRKFNKSRECLKWFTTNGIYTSVHDLITRILQLDVDGIHLPLYTVTCIE